MMIPKSRAETIFRFVITVVVILAVLLAIANLCGGVALVASSLWLALVAMLTWTACREEGGLRSILIDLLGGLFGQRFVESANEIVMSRGSANHRCPSGLGGKMVISITPLRSDVQAASGSNICRQRLFARVLTCSRVRREHERP